MRQAESIVDAAKRLISARGGRFTTQELVKEAGVAMQTFYRHFAGKDQLLLAVLEDIVSEAAAGYEQAARDLPDPLARLRYYITVPVLSLHAPDRNEIAARFVTSEHWRLYQLYPGEVTQVTRPFTDLVARELRAARDAGLLAPADIDRSAAFVGRLVMSMFHHHAFAPAREPVEEIAERLWLFCLNGLGGGRCRPRGAAPEGG